MKKEWKAKIILFGIAAIVALGAIVMWLWNWIVPELFNGPVISYWQAAGLLVLTRILFRGFGGMNRCSMQYGGWNSWKNKWDKMDPEQRERMRELWKKRCGGFNCDEEDTLKKTDHNPEK